jgi:hypothetical protein
MPALQQPLELQGWHRPGCDESLDLVASFGGQQGQLLARGATGVLTTITLVAST